MGEERGRGPLLHGGRGAETPQPMAEASSLGDPPALGGQACWEGSESRRNQDVGDPPKARPTDTPEMCSESQILKIGVQKHF